MSGTLVYQREIKKNAIIYQKYTQSESSSAHFVEVCFCLSNNKSYIKNYESKHKN